jgi:hypothetical protein
LLSVPPQTPAASAEPSAPEAANAPPAPPASAAVESKPLESKAVEVKPFAPVQEQQRTLADSPDARAAAAAAAQAGQLESRVASTARETPQARGAEGKVIPFPARRDDETPLEPEAAVPAPAGAAAPTEPEEEAPISAPPNTPPMAHVIAAQTEAKSKSDPQRSLAPAEPTVREPAVERRREREERVGGHTLNLGSGVPAEIAAKSQNVAASPPPLAAAAAASGPQTLGSTQRFSSSGTQPLDLRAGAEPSSANGAPAASAFGKSHHEGDKSSSRSGAHEALHDDFFSAGEQGMYEGGHGAPSSHQVLDEELEHDDDVPRRIVRTPEQEQRRNKMTQYVGIAVGIALGVFVFALLRGHGSSTPEPKPLDTRAAQAPAPLPPAPEPPPAPAPPPPPPPPPEAVVPEVVTPPPEVVAPAPEPAEKPEAKPHTAERPVKPAEPGAATPRPRPPAGETATPAPRPTQPRPAGPLPPAIPAGKPPTVSFPD